MNILPKKRWHVRNKDNKERVRKDEENARLGNLREKERISLAEQEARLSLLRKKQDKELICTGGELIPSSSKERHLNLFSLEEIEGDASKKSGNTEYIKEKQLEKETYEKKIGLLTYLGQTSLEEKRKEKGPWYLEKKAASAKHTKTEVEDESEAERKSRIDPMSTVQKHLKVREHKHKKRKKKHKKEKKTIASSTKSIDELRTERLQRERSEKERTEILLRGEVQVTSVADEDSNKRRYNSQYMPNIKDRKRTHWKPY